MSDHRKHHWTDEYVADLQTRHDAIAAALRECITPEGTTRPNHCETYAAQLERRIMHINATARLTLAEIKS